MNGHGSVRTNVSMIGFGGVQRARPRMKVGLSAAEIGNTEYTTSVKKMTLNSDTR